MWLGPYDLNWIWLSAFPQPSFPTRPPTAGGTERQFRTPQDEIRGCHLRGKDWRLWFGVAGGLIPTGHARLVELRLSSSAYRALWNTWKTYPSQFTSFQGLVRRFQGFAIHNDQ
jgi:hypothetical protein